MAELNSLNADRGSGQLAGGISNTPPTTLFNNIFYDWLTFSWVFKSEDEYNSVDVLYDVIWLLNVPKEEIASADNAVNGYKRAVKIGMYCLYQEGLLAVNGSYCKMVMFSGKACRWLESLNIDVKKFFKYVQVSGGKCTRFDFSFDDFYGVLDEDGQNKSRLSLIRQYVDAEAYTSKLKSVSVRYDRMNFSDRGFSITFGSGKTVLQIYDKKLERENVDDEDTWLNVWDRYEIRFSEDIANTVFYQYVELLDDSDCDNKMIDFYFGLLSGLIEFKELGHKVSDRYNFCHVQIAKWWEDFIGGFDKIKIRSQFKLESTILTKKNWLLSSAAKPLLKCVLAVPGIADFDKEIGQEMNVKLDKLKPVDYLEINIHQKFEARDQKILDGMSLDQREKYLVEMGQRRNKVLKERFNDKLEKIKDLKMS